MKWWTIHGIDFAAAEFFVSIFHSFEAGIANAISSFKWKIYVFIKNNKK